MKNRYRQFAGQRYRMYATAEECAKKAAPLFTEKGWTWAALVIERPMFHKKKRFLDSCVNWNPRERPVGIH